MGRKPTTNLAYTLLSVAAWSLFSLFFAVSSGRIGRRGPDLYAAADPARFRTYLVIYAVLGTFGLLAGLALLIWQLLLRDG
jgi:hypothetical protein